jgi:hypothetical protein
LLSIEFNLSLTLSLKGEGINAYGNSKCIKTSRFRRKGSASLFGAFGIGDCYGASNFQ